MNLSKKYILLVNSIITCIKKYYNKFLGKTIYNFLYFENKQELSIKVLNIIGFLKKQINLY